MKKLSIVFQRIIHLSVVFTCCLIIIGCSSSNDVNNKDYILSSTEVPLTNCEEDFNIQNVDAVDLYYIDDGSLPYIDVTTYMSLIDDMSQIDVSDIVTDGNQLTIEYDPVLYQSLFFDAESPHPEDPQYRQSMIIDFDEDTVTVSSYLFFMHQGIEGIASESETVFITDILIEQGNPTIIPFYEYGFDFIIEETESDSIYLIPFHVATLLFNYSTLYKTYYNGDSIYGGGLCIFRDEVVRSSSFNGLDIPEDIRLASFNLFTLALDYFSAIKQTRDISSYRSLFLNKIPTLTTIDSDEYYLEFTKLLYQVDDLHAALPSTGYYSSTPSDELPNYPAWNQQIRTDYFNTASVYSQTFSTIFTNSSFPPTVRLLDNEKIAVIHLYQFTETTADEFKEYLDDLPSSIEHVIIDLSMNGGGKIHTIFELLGYMTDQPIVFRNGIAIDGTLRTYTVDVDQKAYDYEWYILTSPVTFSAANITALIAQENDIAVIIGEPPTGGASPVESVLLPCGFTHTISGNYTFYSKEGTAEFGISVDKTMNDFWDNNELINFINSIN